MFNLCNNLFYKIKDHYEGIIPTTKTVLCQNNSFHTARISVKCSNCLQNQFKSLLKSVLFYNFEFIFIKKCKNK